MTVWKLRTSWNPALSAKQKLSAIVYHLATLPRPEEIEAALSVEELLALRFAVQEGPSVYEVDSDEILF